MNNSPSSTSPNTGTGASPSGEEDTQLVERCVSGDNQAFEQLFVKHRQALFAVAWRLLHDEDAALDVVQDAFVKAYEELENLRGEARFYPWLRRIAVNLSIDRLRHNKRSREVSLYSTQGDEPEAREESAAVAAYAAEEQDHSPVDKAEISEFSTALSSALLKLSDPHRTVFMLHAAEGMSYKEIAEALDCNIGTVMSRLFYARKRLQELLGPHLRIEE